MRFVQYLVGACIIMGALTFLTYNGVTLWHSAYELNAKFQELAGWAAVGAMGVECLGLLAAGMLWREKHRLMALGAIAFTIAATLYTLRLEINFQIAGTAETLIQRADNAAENQLIKSELEKQYAVRDKLLAEKRLNKREALTLKRARERIDKLEAKWDARIISIEPAPDAAWLARAIGLGTKEEWSDRIAVLPLFFWMLGRLLVIPFGLTLIGATMSRRKMEPLPAASEAEPAAEPEDDKSTPSLRVISEASTRPATVYESPPRLGEYGKQALRESSDEGRVAEFIAKFIVRDDRTDEEGRVIHLLPSKQAYRHYRAWFSETRAPGSEEEPIAHSRFGTLFLTATGAAKHQRSNGAHYVGFRLRKENRKEVGMSTATSVQALAQAG